MNYIVIRTDSDRNIEVIGKASTEKEAEIIMKDDFKEWFWQKMDKSEFESFEDALNKCEEDEEGRLSKNRAWLNRCLDTDFDWKIIETTTEVLKQPMTLKEIVLTTSDDDYVCGNVVVEVDEIIGYGLEEFLDLLSERLVGNPCLMEVNYKAIDTTEDGKVVFRVTGDASDILRLDENMREELKRCVLNSGVNALKELLGDKLVLSTDAVMMAAMDEVLLYQMPDEEQCRLYRKYCS